MMQEAVVCSENNPMVSIILTSYNHGAFIAHSIESILNQSYRNYELIIVDDASSDDSWKIIQSYAQRDDRIRAIGRNKNVNEENCSIPILYGELRGDYIAIAHSDDAWAPTKLQKQIDYLEQEKETAACFTWVSIIDDDGNLLKNSDHFFATAFAHKNRSRFEWLHFFFFEGCPLCHPSLLIRKDAYHKYNLFTSGLHSIPDFCKWIRLCIHADIHVIEEKLTLFRVHADESNTSGNTYENRVRTTLEDYLVLSEFKAITDPDMFLKIFPEAKRYCRDNELMIPFALAQMGLQGSWKMHKLFALEILYGLMQNPEEKKKMRLLYGYSEREYTADKIRFDIFGVIPSKQIAHGYLFVWFAGDDQVHMFPQDYPISTLGFGCVSWDLEEVLKAGDPTSIVFAVDTDYARKVKIEAVEIGSHTVSLEAINRSCEEDGWDVFFSPLSRYRLSTIDRKGVLSIKLLTEPIKSYYASEYLRELEQELKYIKSSKSWRLSQPLRSIVKRLRQLSK